jgi:transcriptional repressor NrdR
VTSLQRRFESSGESEITTVQIGESVMQALAHLDKIAYIRFASVYKDFKDVSEFVATIEKLSDDSEEEN